MSDPRHALGRRAEAAVARWLTRCGWRVLAARARSRGGGEVDLVALDPNGVLVAVEVRARRSHRTGEASASLDRDRVPRLRRTLVAFAARTRERHAGLRVDLVTAEPDGDGWRLRRHVGIGEC